MARQGEVTTLAQAQAYVAHLTMPDADRHVFAMTTDEHLVGAVGVLVDTANRTGWFWYWTHAAHRGHGWTSAAATTVADWALTQGGCERLELGHRVNNPASGAVARAAGFVREGREREKFLVDGERVDVLTYGRLRSDPAPAGPRLPLTTATTTTAQPPPTGRDVPGEVRIAVEPAAALTRDEVLALYGAVGWTSYTREADTLLAALAGSHRLATARVAGELVGLARAISDGHTIVYVQDVLVHPGAQRTGLGTRLLEVLLHHYRSVRQQVLLTDAEPGQRAFYESLGFTEVHDQHPPLRAFVRL